MSRQRFGFGLLLVLVLALSTGGLLLRNVWHGWLQDNGVVLLQWQGVTVSRSGMMLEQLSLEQEHADHRIALQGQGLALRWHLDWPQLQLDVLSIEQLSLDWKDQPDTGIQAVATPELDTGVSLAIPDAVTRWLPREVNIAAFRAELPCAAGRCPLTGALSLSHPQSLFPMQAELVLDHEGHSVKVQAGVAGSPPGDFQATTTLIMDGKPHLSLQSSYRAETAVEAARWTGSLELPALQQEHWLLAWLQQWQQQPVSATPASVSPKSVSSKPAFSNFKPYNATLSARWQMQSPVGTAFLQQAAGDVTLTASLPELALAGLTLKGLEADLRFTGKLEAGVLALELGTNSLLQLKRLDITGSKVPVGLDALRADLRGLQLSAVFDPEQKVLRSAGLRGPLQVTVQKLRHAALRPQPWTFRGELEGDFSALNLAGVLSAKAGAEAKVNVKAPVGGALEAMAQLLVAGGSGSSALAATLTAWPPLLTFETGKLNASASLKIPAKGDQTLRAKLVFTELSGIYDRLAWSGLTGTVDLDTTLNRAPARLNLQFPALVLGQLNPGIPLGPVNLSGRYVAALDQIAAGQLELQRGTAGFAGGQVLVTPAVWNLASLPLQVPLQLSGLQLARLLELYPAEGLAGTGSLNGQLPVTVGPAGISVDKGQVAALAAGGTLSIPLEQLRALGQSNAAMQQVVQALQNFHYSVLGSTIDYAQNGILVLGLHLEGRNPDLRKGQAYNFNITLEEDIPALLTSLQLSGRVSDAVTERVKQQFGGKNTNKFKNATTKH